MPLVKMSIQDFPTGITVIFIQNNQRIGPMRRYHSEEPIFLILRRAHANLETINIVEMALQQSRPCMVELNLTDEQYRKLSSR